MRELVPTVLGDRGIEWIRDFVVCGPYEEGDALCAAVATSLDLSQGTVVTLLPVGAVDRVDATDLEGNVFAALKDQSISADALGTLAADAAIELARTAGGDLFLCQADVTRAGYRPNMTWGEGVVLSPDRVVFCGTSVMPWGRLSDVTTDEVGWLVGSGLGVISSIGVPPLAASREMTQESLDTIVRGARALLVGAYDGMSLLLWRPIGP